MKGKVFVALSGGVDSSVAAYLLKKEGYNIHGAFMKNWEECNWHEERRSAEAVAAHLDIPFEVWDFTEEYKKYILKNFYSEYKKGKTPNPDILCNKIVKFGYFLKKAKKEGADFIATGHYVRKGDDGLLKKGIDENKDQSYFLWSLEKEQIEKTLFPIGEHEKKDVRMIAKKAGLNTAEKKDSQGLCFVGDIQIKDFLKGHVTTNKGKIVNEDGKDIGEHKGIAYYTEGQREGLYIGGQKEPHYVSFRDVNTNTIIATPRENVLNYSTKIYLKDVLLHDKNIVGKEVGVKIRYRQDDQKGILKKLNSKYVIEFRKPQFAVSLGQSAVLYKGDVLIGGGIIDKVDRQFSRINEILKKHGNK